MPLLVKKLDLPPIPPRLRDFTTNKHIDLDWEQYDILMKEGWQHFEPAIERAGYRLALDYLVLHYGSRRCALYPPCPNPFRPSVDAAENYVAYNYAFPPFTLAAKLTWDTSHPRVCGAIDEYERPVFLKLISPDETGDEVRIWRRLNDLHEHDDEGLNHTVPLLECLSSDSWTILVAPEWTDLSASLKFIYLPRVVDFLDMAKQILEGVAFMHAHSIAHCDINLHNVVMNHAAASIAQGFNVTLCKPAFGFIDFGTSVECLSGPGSAVKVPMPVGTPGHWAPEVRRTFKPDEKIPEADPFACDVYSAGKTLQNYLIQYIEREREVVQRGVVWPMPRSFPDIPSLLIEHAPSFLDFLDTFTHRDPAERPTAAQALAELRKLISDMSESVLHLPDGADGPVHKAMREKVRDLTTSELAREMEYRNQDKAKLLAESTS